MQSRASPGDEVHAKFCILEVNFHLDSEIIADNESKGNGSKGLHSSCSGRRGAFHVQELNVPQEPWCCDDGEECLVHHCRCLHSNRQHQFSSTTEHSQVLFHIVLLLECMEYIQGKLGAPRDGTAIYAPVLHILRRPPLAAVWPALRIQAGKLSSALRPQVGIHLCL